MRSPRFTAAISAAALILTSCGGGGGGSNDFGGTPSPSPAPAPAPTPTPPPNTGGNFTPPAQESLTIGEVQQIIAQAVGEAQARNLPSIIAVVDRVGNVLGCIHNEWCTGPDRTEHTDNRRQCWSGFDCWPARRDGAQHDGRHREGDYRRLSFQRWQCVFNPNSEPDCPGTFPACTNNGRTGKRSTIWRAIQPTTLFGLEPAVQSRRRRCIHDWPQEITSRSCC